MGYMAGRAPLALPGSPYMVHSVVRVHPETGEKGLFVNPNFTRYILDVSYLESEAILNLLYDQLAKPEFHVRFRWERSLADPNLVMRASAIVAGNAVRDIRYELEHSEQGARRRRKSPVNILDSVSDVSVILLAMIGFALHLTQPQFGLWAALAIHDTSSVVGAAAHYGPQALTVGTTVKLARALWIVPLALVTAAVSRSSTRIQWPWFILYFCLAAVANTYMPALAPLFNAFARLGRSGLTVTLFLIGSGISKATLQKVGVRPMLQGVVLWIIIATLSLWAIRSGLIGI